MFEDLARFDQIVVTGPQRSGTTICARMIAHDTGLRYIDEDKIGIHNLPGLLELLKGQARVVVQCPGLSRWCHKLPAGVLVVWMRRPLAQVLASQERIEWGGEARERRKYEGSNGDPIAAVKNRFWETRQRPAIESWAEIRYEHLANHPLWVPKDKRNGFGPRQWRVGG